MVKMARPRTGIAVTATTLIAVVVGAMATSDPGIVWYRTTHYLVSGCVTLLTVIFSLQLWPTESFRRLGAGLIGMLLFQALPATGPESFKIFHACLAQMFFALTVAASLMCSNRWLEGPRIVEDGGFPSLRFLSVLAFSLTLIQVVLGAALRHGVMGVVPHVIGAIVLAVILLMVSTFVITQFPKHSALLTSAWVLISIAILQPVLGVITYLNRLSFPAGSAPSGSLVATTAAHVGLGAVTLASTAVLALEVHYHVRRPAAVQSGLSAIS